MNDLLEWIEQDQKRAFGCGNLLTITLRSIIHMLHSDAIPLRNELNSTAGKLCIPHLSQPYRILHREEVQKSRVTSQWSIRSLRRCGCARRSYIVNMIFLLLWLPGHYSWLDYWMVETWFDSNYPWIIYTMAGFSWATVIANLLVPVGILIFSSGFFPYKPLIPGLATLETADAAPAIFDKVIFMVVDALRRYGSKRACRDLQ